MEIKKDGCLKPSNAHNTPNTNANPVAFEKDWLSDAYFKAIFISKLSTPGISFSPADMLALLFDEHDLLIKGYLIDEEQDSDNRAHRSQLQSMVSRNELPEAEYKQIGTFVYINDKIPLDYLVAVDIPDINRLSNIGLI
ncbi:MAG: hypothetical protein JW864_08595 [Spirochaetes bacterium]|nr:hypothetical protein [Spirochaetota bacterium]